MPNRKATEAEVQEYFNKHPEHLEMMISDWKETGDPNLEWETVFDFTEFDHDSELGIVPTYWDTDFLTERTPEWTSVIYELYEYNVYKILWFVVATTKEFDDHEIMIFSSNEFEIAIDYLLNRAEQLWPEYSDFFSNWQSQIFSN